MASGTALSFAERTEFSKLSWGFANRSILDVRTASQFSEMELSSSMPKGHLSD